MSDETKVDYAAELRRIGSMIGRSPLWRDEATDLFEAADLLDEREATIARLEAEVERLTPREMSLEECWRHLNAVNHKGQKWIIAARDPQADIIWNSLGETMTAFEAQAIVEKLLRDAAASAGEGETKSLTDAAKTLSENLGRPSWLSCIGVGADSIRVMLNHEPPVGAIPSMWHGFVVETRVTGPMRLCGDTASSGEGEDARGGKGL